MASNDTAVSVTAPPPPPPDGLILTASAVAAYEAMFARVPEAAGGGAGAIVEALATAETVADLDAPWRTEGLRPWVDRPLEVQGIRRAPSSFEGGLPWFLVIDAVALDTGEEVVLTSGAVAVVAQLVRAHALGALPLRVVPRQTPRPTARGYHPMHLEVSA